MGASPIYLSPWARTALARYGITIEGLRARLGPGEGLAIAGESRQGPWTVSNGLHPLRETPRVADLRTAIDQAIEELRGVGSGRNG